MRINFQTHKVSELRKEDWKKERQIIQFATLKARSSVFTPNLGVI